MTLNLETVNTVTDLVTQNNTPVEPNTSRLDSLIEQLDLTETFELSLKLVQRLGYFHQSVIDDLKTEGTELDRLVIWTQDEQKLHQSYNLISDVFNND